MLNNLTRATSLTELSPSQVLPHLWGMVVGERGISGTEFPSVGCLVLRWVETLETFLSEFHTPAFERGRLSASLEKQVLEAGGPWGQQQA